jgi:hypothetical protein
MKLIICKLNLQTSHIKFIRQIIIYKLRVATIYKNLKILFTKIFNISYF